MSAIVIIGEIRREGATVALDGDKLRLRPRPGGKLSPDLVERVKAAKPSIVAYLTSSPATPLAMDYEERAAISEYDGGLPREIAEGLARMQTMRPLRGFSRVRWIGLVDGACKFADGWGGRALALGWTEIELFGALPIAPTSVDCRGLALMLADRDVAMLDEAVAILRPHAGGEQRYRRWTENRGAKLIWEITATDADASEGT